MFSFVQIMMGVDNIISVIIIVTVIDKQKCKVTIFLKNLGTVCLFYRKRL